jgi:hypothetical protein
VAAELNAYSQAIRQHRACDSSLDPRNDKLTKRLGI